MENWTILEEKLFDTIRVRFPVEEKLSIIIGTNGNYKTQTIEALSRHYTQNGENVLYFPHYRVLEVDKDQIGAAYTLNKLAYDNFFSTIDMKAAMFAIEREVGDYINRGTSQLLNFLTQILKEEDVVVIVDCPEVNLDMYAKRNFINSILSLENVKRLIVVTHQPEIIEVHHDKTINIEACLDKGEGFNYNRRW